VQIQVSSTSTIPLEVHAVPEAPFVVRGPGILIWVHQ
jgi:hypothetical protein